MYLDIRCEHVVAYSQGSVVKMPEPAGGLPRVFYFLQYCAVAAACRGGGVMQTMHAVNSATLQAFARRTQHEAIGLLWETEPNGLGEHEEARRFTRSQVVLPALHNWT
jgi:hypothetical protein